MEKLAGVLHPTSFSFCRDVTKTISGEAKIRACTPDQSREPAPHWMRGQAPCGDPPNQDDILRSLKKTCIQAAKQGEVPVAAACIDMRSSHAEFSGNTVKNNKSPLSHAECSVLEKMSRLNQSPNLAHCILISTLEPCTMCMGAIATAKITGLMYFISDEKTGYFSTHGISVSSRAQTSVRVGTHTLWVHHGLRYAGEFIDILSTFFASLR